MQAKNILKIFQMGGYCLLMELHWECSTLSSFNKTPANQIDCPSVCSVAYVPSNVSLPPQQFLIASQDGTGPDTTTITQGQQILLLENAKVCSLFSKHFFFDTENKKIKKNKK